MFPWAVYECVVNGGSCAKGLKIWQGFMAGKALYSVLTYRQLMVFLGNQRWWFLEVQSTLIQHD